MDVHLVMANTMNFSCSIKLNTQSSTYAQAKTLEKRKGEADIWADCFPNNFTILGIYASMTGKAPDKIMGEEKEQTGAKNEGLVIEEEILKVQPTSCTYYGVIGFSG